MGIEEIKLGTNVQAVDTAKVISVLGEKDKVQTIDFSNARTIGAYETNSNANVFLREYLYGKAAQKGVKIPEGMVINISSPKEYSDEFKELLRSVRVDIYGARVLDMFNLLTQDKAIVEKRVAGMKITDEEKAKVLALKEMFDDYYRVEANYNGKNYNLLNLSDVENAELKSISNDFVKFLKEERSELLKHTIDFARGEIESVELAEAAEDSKKAVPILLSVLGILGAKELIQTWQERKALRTDLKGFVAEQKILSRQKVFKIVNPFTEIKTAIKGKKGMAALIAMSPILLNTLAGSVDDLSGAGKDLFQDKDCFGWGTASAIAGASVVGGVGTSFAIAGIYERARDVLKARRVKGRVLMDAAREAGQLERFNALKKVMRPSLANRLLRGGKFALVGGLFGAVVASCTSGSSWTSMAATRFMFGKNGDDLEKKNIITPEENTFKSANENMMKYEAYKGKWRGIAVGPTSDPVVGFTLGATGLLTHPVSMVANTAFTTQGCSETLTACGYQLLGNKLRENALDKQKAELVASVQQ